MRRLAPAAAAAAAANRQVGRGGQQGRVRRQHVLGTIQSESFGIAPSVGSKPWRKQRDWAWDNARQNSDFRASGIKPSCLHREHAVPRYSQPLFSRTSPAAVRARNELLYTPLPSAQMRPSRSPTSMTSRRYLPCARKSCMLWQPDTNTTTCRDITHGCRGRAHCAMRAAMRVRARAHSGTRGRPADVIHGKGSPRAATRHALWYRAHHGRRARPCFMMEEASRVTSHQTPQRTGADSKQSQALPAVHVPPRSSTFLGLFDKPSAASVCFDAPAPPSSMRGRVSARASDPGRPRARERVSCRSRPSKARMLKKGHTTMLVGVNMPSGIWPERLSAEQQRWRVC
jgi:hypothetical protein